MTYRISAALGILALVVGFSFITAPGQAEAKRWSDYATVRIEGSSLIPVTVTVKAGMTVRWVNFDETAQDITSGAAGSPDGKFRSGPLAQDGFYEVTLNEKGTYPYYSSNNPSIKGTVIVK